VTCLAQLPASKGVCFHRSDGQRGFHRPKRLQNMMRCQQAWSHVVLYLSCAAVLPLQAATTGSTNKAVISYALPFPGLEFAERSEVLSERFFQEVMTSNSIVFDRFSSPSSRLGWERRENRLGYVSLDNFNSDGANMFATMGLDSLRTAAIEVLPFERWQDSWLGRLAPFIAGTIGNPQEEHIEVTSISYSAVRSSWERENANGGIQWGLRPWRTSPYFYLLAHAGRWDGQPLITLEGRAGYTLLGSTHIEGRVTLPLPASFRIAAAGSFDPGRMGSRDTGATHVGVALERVVHSRSLCPKGAFYVGFRSTVDGASSNLRHENLVVAGFSRVW